MDQRLNRLRTTRKILALAVDLRLNGMPWPCQSKMMEAAAPPQLDAGRSPAAAPGGGDDLKAIKNERIKSQAK